MNRRNYRRHLLTGIRERISREKYGAKLVMLWSFLLDVSGLPV